MRKLLSLLLCLTLFLSVMAMTEAEALETFTVDFGDFTMKLCEGDYYEVAPEKIDNEVYAMIYPLYDESATSHDYIHIAWTKDDLSDLFTIPGGADAFANEVLESVKQQYESMGIKVTDEEVLGARYEDGFGAFITFVNLDYNATGIDIILPLYYLQSYICDGEIGSYVFTIRATSAEDVADLSYYIDTVKFK